MTNRLALETSPYLLQHQHNPVEWYPWGTEAFNLARQLNKPIFLSVGYSTCYWCHVMERQCFEVESIATIMNDVCVCIKVDREERPDVDQLYMNAVQIMTRQGGWPMSVFLTPELKPFYAGTYFPPTDAHGRPGFPTLLKAIDDAWKNRRDQIEKTANDMHRMLAQVAGPDEPDAPMTITRSIIDIWIDQSTSDYDPKLGGYGHAPKFPRQTLLELLLEQIATGSSDNTDSLKHTLNAMANGGIRDHLGGGFHRYSTDARWLVPHFEIMLYDNAMLGGIYARASQVLNEPRYATIARGIFDFVLREMTSPEGAFYTAIDAEVDAQEGLNYLWTIEEIEEVLGGRDAGIFASVYGLDNGPNFADPHHGTGLPDKNILYLPRSAERESDPAIINMRQKLYDARCKRKQPLLDTKILTSWCALMIHALADAGRILNEPRYIQASCKAVDFLLTQHRTPDGGLYRTSRNGIKKYAAYLDDYAFLVQALLSCSKASGDAQYRLHAIDISTQMQNRFEDTEKGGFYFSDQSADDLIVRQKTFADSPLPSGNAIAACVLLELGQIDTAARAIAICMDQLNNHVGGMSSVALATLLFVNQIGELHVEPGKHKPAVLIPKDADDHIVAVKSRWDSPDRLVLILEISPGYHINSAQTADNLIPTSITFDAPWSSDITGVHLPQPTRWNDIDVYAGRIEIGIDFQTPPKDGSVLTIRLRYQPCTESECLAVMNRKVGIHR